MDNHRISLYRQFVERFRPEESRCCVVPVTHGDIDAAEAAIGSVLPTSYRTFVTTVGAGENDAPGDPCLALGEIWQPEWIVRQVKEEWWAPIPAFLNAGRPIASDVAWRHLTPFGSERSDGFWFCFPRALDRSDDAPVFFFNHDGGDIDPVADSFDDMIRRLLNDDTART